jgi:hypothetical protein
MSIMKLIQKLVIAVLVCVGTLTTVFGATSVSAAAAECPWWNFLDSGCAARQEDAFKKEVTSNAAFLCTNFKNSNGLLVAALVATEAARFRDPCITVFDYSGDKKSVTAPVSGAAVVKYNEVDKFTQDQKDKLYGMIPGLCGYIEGSYKNTAILTALSLTQKSYTGVLAICNLNANAERQYTNSTNDNTNSLTPDNGSCGIDFGCIIKNFLQTFAKAAAGLVAGVLAVLTYLLAYVVNLIVSVLSYFANELLLINPASNQYIGVARSVFGVFSNLVNLIILFLFIKTGFSFIFDDKKTPDLSTFIISIATIAIGVQFSFALAAAVIALSFNIGYIFLVTLSPAESNPFTAFYKVINESLTFSSGPGDFLTGVGQKLGAILSGQEVSVGSSDLISTAAVQGVRLFIFLISAWLMWLFVQKFALRAVSLFFLLITAPIGFVFLVAGDDLDKDVKKFGDQWWEGLINNSIAYPIIVIGLGIGARLVNQVSQLSAGANIDVNGLNLLDPGTYALLIGPLIQKTLPGVIGVATLYLIYQWIEDNLKSAVGGVTQKLLGLARNGWGVTKNALQMGARGIGKGAALGSAIGGKIGLGGVGARIAQFGNDSRNAIGAALNTKIGSGEVGKNFSKAMRGSVARQNKAATAMQTKQARIKTFGDARRSMIESGAAFQKVFDGVASLDGEFNPVRLFSRSTPTVGKDGKVTWTRTKNARNLEEDAETSAGKAEAAHWADFVRRKSAKTPADIADADRIARESGIKSVFLNQGAADLEAMGMDKAEAKMRAQMDRDMQAARSKTLGLRGNKDNKPGLNIVRQSMEKVLNTNGLNINSENADERKAARDAVTSKILSDTTALGQFIDLAEDPDSFVALMNQSPVFKKFATSKVGLDILKAELQEDFDEFYIKTFNATNGNLPFDEQTKSELREDSTYNGLMEHIDNEIKKVVLDPKKAGARAFKNAQSVVEILESAKKTGPLAVNNLAQESNSLGLGFTTAGVRKVLKDNGNKGASNSDSLNQELNLSPDLSPEQRQGLLESLDGYTEKILTAQAEMISNGGVTGQLLAEINAAIENGEDPLNINNPAELNTKLEVLKTDNGIRADGTFSSTDFAYSESTRNSGTLDAAVIPRIRMISQQLASGASIDRVVNATNTDAEKQSVVIAIAQAIDTRAEANNNKKVKEIKDKAIADPKSLTQADHRVLAEALENTADAQIKSSLNRTIESDNTAVAQSLTDTGNANAVKATGKSVLRSVVASDKEVVDLMNQRGADMSSSEFKNDFVATLSTDAAKRDSYQKSEARIKQQEIRNRAGLGGAPSPTPSPTPQPNPPVPRGSRIIQDRAGNDITIGANGAVLSPEEIASRNKFSNLTTQQIAANRGTLQNKIRVETDPVKIAEHQTDLNMLDDIELFDRNQNPTP